MILLIRKQYLIVIIELEVLSTIKLLNLLFNGKLSYRNCREQRFYDEFIQNEFLSYVVDEYMSGEKEYYYPVIKNSWIFVVNIWDLNMPLFIVTIC